MGNKSLKHIENTHQIDQTSKGLAHHFGELGIPFCSHLGGLGGFVSQVRLRRRFGRLLGDLKSQHGFNLEPKMVPSWNRNGKNIDAKIVYFLMPLRIDFE